MIVNPPNDSLDRSSAVLGEKLFGGFCVVVGFLLAIWGISALMTTEGVSCNILGVASMLLGIASIIHGFGTLTS